MARKTHEDRAHAPLPPSASSRWLKCAPAMGYVRHLIDRKVIKKRKSGEAAERGTRIHELAEPVIVSLIDKGKMPKMPKGAAKDEWDEAVSYALFCHDTWLAVYDLDDEAIYGVELRAVVTDECWGSSDFWVYGAKRLTTCDLKTGREIVYAKDNTQLLLYTLGVIRTKLSVKYPVREVEAIIYQPNAHGAESPHDSHVYTLPQFNDHVKRLLHGIKEATGYLEPDLDTAALEARLVAGSHCSWCDAFAVCPAAKAHAMSTVSQSFAPVATKAKPGKAVAKASAKMPDPGSLEAEQVGQILEKAPMFSAWLEAVQMRAVELVQRGETIPGFKVVQKITRRAWESKYSAPQIAKKLGVGIGEITDIKLKSPAQVEKLLDKKKKSRVDDLTFKPVGSPTIVPESDRRQAIASSKIHFEPVSESEDD